MSQININNVSTNQNHNNSKIVIMQHLNVKSKITVMCKNKTFK